MQGDANSSNTGATGPRLTPTSYIVLGMLEWTGEATPYELKRLVAQSVGSFWTLQHAQLYTEPQRLAGAGYVSEEREHEGRRRRRYSLTDKGRAALAAWRSTPTGDLYELRDPGLLKLFFGGDPAQLAPVQLAAHRRRLAEYEALQGLDGGGPPRGPWLALDAGVRHEREWIRYWEELAAEARSAKARSNRPRSTDGRRTRR